MKQTTKKGRSSASGVRWDLRDLYNSPDDPKIDVDFKRAKESAENFEKRYKGIFSKKPLLKAENLAKIVAEYESILELRDRPHIYAHLLFAEDTQNEKYGKLLQEMQSRSTEIQKHLIFFELEWCALDDKSAKSLIENKACARYRHFLSAVRRYKPHLLSESEEKIIDELENTGSRAFCRLFDQLLGSMKFEVKVHGKRREMSEQEALALLHDSDRETRKAAAEGLTKGFENNLKILTFIFNTLVQNHYTLDRLRKYPDPMAKRNLANEIDRETVDALLTACDSNTELVSRYYKLKAKLLGIKKLYDYDRYAPISAKMPKITWTECKNMVLESFDGFSPELGKIAKMFFEKNWIDAEIRDGKRGGAFSCSSTTDTHPYILVNYTDNLRDAMTVAHELGHGCHQYLARERGWLNADTPLTLAETASVFGEMLVFHNIMEKQKNPAIKLSLLCGKIEDTFATVFRQACMTRFEQKVHETRRKEGELSSETISDFWMEANRQMFGDSVVLSPGYRLWWCYIPHFIHTPFYCYAYSFGELLVLSLYARYKKIGSSFIPKYLELLSAGGSESPEELTKRIGIDIKKPSFWIEGIQMIEEMVTEAEKLSSEL